MEGIAVALKSAEDVKAVAAELRRNTRTNLFYCAWVMQYESALRISDLLTLTWSQFSAGKTHIEVKQQKSKRKAAPNKKVKPLRIKITDTMRKIVEMRREEQSTMPVKTDFIFSKGDLRSRGNAVTRNTVFTEFSKIGRRVGFSNVGCHTPRKSKGRILFSAGVPVEQIALLLGHADPRSTLFYIGYTLEVGDELTEEFSLEI